MPDLLQNGLKWLDAQRKAHLSHAVTYRRQGVSVEVQASNARSEWESVDGDGGVQRFETRDFLITAADLVLGDMVSEPRAGDRITDAGHVFEVMPPAGGAVFRYCDPGRTTLRICTKHVGQEA